MGRLTLTEREHAVLEIIGQHEDDAGGKGIAAGEICQATQGFPPETRVWTSQQAARVAGILCDLGWARGARTPQRTYYRLSSMGRGYLSEEVLT